ncbi:MAG: glycosyl hydrolase 115 family protein, partial [Bryobacteraceae bacterium]
RTRLPLLLESLLVRPANGRAAIQSAAAMSKRILLVLAVCVRLAAQTVVDGRTTLVVSAREPGAVLKAVDDLARDLEAVLGRKLARAEKAPVRGTAIVAALRENVPAETRRPREEEALLIEERGGKVVLTGGDVRGTIYAIYRFSQTQLGVDPLWWWTDHPPARKARVTVASGYRLAEGTPAFRRRGWFLNDEDLLTGWKPATPGGTGVSLGVWDRVFEALLRLKGNMIVPGTFIFPDEPQVKAAGERGLMITQHHIEVLGTNTWKWPEEAPYSFAEHAQILKNAWRHSMLGYGKEQEVIWTVGYRGRHDRAFWLDDQSIPPTEEARAAAIRSAIDAQVEIVKAERVSPRFIMNAWAEAVPLIQKGLLTLPEGVTLVWPDNGHGLIRDAGRIARGQGVYYHTAMHDFVANQLTEMVPPERIERELGRAAKAGATEYLLVNVSDVRPYPLTTRAAMEAAVHGQAWGWEPYLGTWCREEFGERAARAMAEYYRAYFQAPGRSGAAEHETLADNAYHNYLRFILVSLIKGRPELSARFIQIRDWDQWLSKVKRAAADAEPRWERARALAEKAAGLVPEERKAFFQGHVMTQLEIHRRSNKALRLGAEAWAERGQGAAKVTETIAELKAVLAAMDAAEYGKWKDFYREDRFVNVRHTLALAEGARSKLEGRGVPVGLRVEALVEDPYHWLKSYQGGRRVDVR